MLKSKMAVLLMVLALFSCQKSHVESGCDTQKPNILIIYADDLGFGDLRCYNKKSKIPTPHLDTLASQGIRFTDGHSSSGICTPSRYALFTGRHHWRKFHRIVGSFGNSVFVKNDLTMAKMLQSKGYHTAAIGKWHLGWDWSALIKPGKKFKGRQGKFRHDDFDWSQKIPRGPLAVGFDHYFGDVVINFPPYCWIENDKVVKAPDTMMDTQKFKKIKEGGWEFRYGPMVTGWDPYENIPVTTQKAVDYIKKQSKTDQPYFLYFAFPSPHAPIVPNDEFDGKSQAGPYGDFVFETDDAIGKILKAVKESGEEGNTLVIFSSDNGPENYAYPRVNKFDHWSSYPLRGLKRDVYEGGHRVPFIIKWPGQVKEGEVSHELVSQIDLMATLASIVGAQLPENQAEDSHDLLPLITGRSKKSPRVSHVHNTFAHVWAIRDDDWVLVDAKSGYHTKGTAGWEKKNGYQPQTKPALYNIKTDIGQKKDLFDKYPEKVKAMRELMKKIRDQGYSAPRLTK